MFPEDFLRLLNNCSCLVGNSSVGIRECSFLGVPAVNVGNRQRGRERGFNVIDVDHKRETIGRAIRQHLAQGRSKRDTLYGDGSAGIRIADELVFRDIEIEKRLTF